MIRGLLPWLAALLVCAGSLLAQEVTSPAIAIADVNRRLQTPTETQAKRVSFRGVVIQWASNPREVFVQEGRSGVAVKLLKSMELPRLGDEVEVVADVQFTNPGPDSEVTAVAARTLRHPGLPEPIRCSLVDTTTGQYNRLAVEVEGTVLHASRHYGLPWVMLSDASGAAMAGVYSWPPGWSPESLVGRRVRIRGVAAGVWQQALRCSTPDEIEVLPPSGNEPMQKPLTRIEDVLGFVPEPATAQMHPVLLRAVCTQADPAEKQFAVHDGRAGLMVKMPPFDPGGKMPQPGDEVSLAGVAISTNGSTRLQAWTVEILGPGKLPAPVGAAFTAPRRTIREVLAAPVSKERMVITGVVQCAVKSGTYALLIIRDATGAAFVYAPEAPAGGGAPDPVRPVPGDRVEGEGRHITVRVQSPQLFEAAWRVVGHEALPEPPLVALAEALAIAFDGRRVRLQGRVVDYETFTEYGRKVSRLWLRSGDVVTYGNFLGDEYAAAPAKVGQLVEITGVCNVSLASANVVRGFSVQMNSMAEARALPEPPPWSDPTTRRMILTVAVALLAAIAWVALLRRQVRLRTATLEARETELRRALSREQELGNLKTAFISMVSHEFRTPLNVIVTSSDILARYLTRLSDEERAEHLGSIAKSVRRMAGMMEDVLLLGRFEAGQQKLQPGELHLVAWCRRFVDEMRSATGGRCPIELTMGDFEPIVRADESILRHILANLISNAVKYSREGESVQLRVEQEGMDAVFRVEDHGIGIPREDREHLFEAFHRGGNVGQISGTGLGLVVVKRGTELHRGTVAFASEEGRGTTFTVRLPLFGEPRKEVNP